MSTRKSAFRAALLGLLFASSGNFAHAQDYNYSSIPQVPPTVTGYSTPGMQVPVGTQPIVDPPHYTSYYDSAAQANAALQSSSAVPIVPLPQTSPVVNDRLSKLEKRLDEADAAKKKLPSVTVSGVFQADGVWFNQSDESRDQHGSIESGADIRRARIGARSQVTETMNAFMQMDFGFFGRPTFTDVWVEQTKVPVLGTVRAGQWKQPFSLEVVSSFRYTTFMERSLLFQSFTPFRHLGIGFYNNSDDLNWTWAASYFRTGQDQFANSLSTDGGNGVAGRLTHLLWYCGEHGEDYLHVGGGYFMNSPPRDSVRFRTIPEIFVGEFAPGGVGTSGQAVPGVLNGTPFFADTGTLNGVSDVQTFGLEALWVRGPLSVQSEAMAATVNQAGPTAVFGGTYAQVGYFLTGEHRPYDRKGGAIDRVLPFNSVGKGGRGAWEVAARYSYVDLSDGLVRGGNVKNMTGGLNWYINANCKWVFNYIHSWSEGPDFFPAVVPGSNINGQTDAFATRVQVDF